MAQAPSQLSWLVISETESASAVFTNSTRQRGPLTDLRKLISRQQVRLKIRFSRGDEYGDLLWLPPESFLVPLRCVICGPCALAFLRRAPAFLAAVGASRGWVERLLVWRLGHK